MPQRGHFLAGILVDDRLIGRYVNAAVFFGSRQTEDVIVLVDCAADGAEAVVAVCHGVGKRELGHAAGAGRLDNAHVGNIVRNHRVKAKTHLGRISGHIVLAQNLIGYRLLASLRGRAVSRTGFGNLGLMYKIDPMRIALNHWNTSFCIKK